MAQDKKKALDDKTRKLAGGKVEEGKEHAAYQETQQQLLAIQAEQQQNLAVARAESKASFNNNQTLAQAAELGAISAAEAEQAAQAGGQVTLNPATQSVLAKYGVGQPKFQRTQSHNQQITKQNITINNNITSNTTNDVKIPAGVGGPLQGRPLQFKDPAVVTSSTNKFKTWISAAFARQNEEGAKRDREYRQRESSLTKSANRMMKKLEDIGKTIGTRMDPRKIGSTWQSQLKTLLLLFGFGYLTSNWTKVLDTVASIEEWVKGTWNYFTGNAENGGKTFISDIKSFLGGNDNETIFESLYKLFLGNDGFLGRLKDYFETLYKDRSEAVKSIDFPTLNPKSVVESLGELGKYLSKILSAIVGGTDAMKTSYTTAEADTDSYKSSLNHLNEAKENDYKYSPKDTFKLNGKDSNGKEVEYKADAGVLSILNPNSDYKGITNYTLNDDGSLNKNYITEATIGSSSELSRIMDQLKEGNTKNVSSAAQQLYNLFEASKEKGSIVISPDLIYNTLSESEQNKLIRSGDIKFERYHIVRRKKTDKDYITESRGEINPIDRAIAAEITNKGSRTLTALVNGPGYAMSPGMAATKDIAWNEYNKTTHRFELVKNIDPNADYEDTGKTEEVAEISPKTVLTIGKYMSESPNAINVFTMDKEANKANIEQLFLNGNGLNRRAQQYQKIIEDFDKKYRTGKTYHIIKDDDGSEKLWMQGGGNDSSYWKKIKNQYETDRVYYDNAKKFFNNREAIQEEGYSGNYSKVAETEAYWQKKHDETWKSYEERHTDDRPAKAGRAFGAAADKAVNYMLETSDNLFGTNLLSLKQKYTHVKNYIDKIRPLIVTSLKSKDFIKPEEVEKYADILTAQSALESDWGRSELSKYNNFSGMIKGTAKHSSGETTIKENSHRFETFNSIEDWVDDYIEYLNRKWNAFDKGPNEFLNQIENSSLHQGQSYSGGDKEYSTKIKSILFGNREFQINPNEVAQKAVEASKAGKFYSDSRNKYIDLGKDNYKGLCTSGPATWYEEAGLGHLNLHDPNVWWNTGNPKTATDTNITEKGFSEIWSGSAEDAKANRMNDVLQPGDVLVSYGYHKKDGSPSAHAQMWDGEHWLSDTIQNSTFVYGSGRMGDRSAVLYRYGNDKTNSNIQIQPTPSSKKSNRPVEEKSFWSILKEETMKLIGGIFGGDDEEIPVQPEEVTPKQDITSQPPIEPVSVPAEEVNIAQQDVREDTKNILERYIKSKEPNKETTTISSTTLPKVDPLITQNLNTSDQFDLINSTESKQNPTYIFDNLTNNIIEVRNGVDTLIELTAMNGSIISDGVDAVNRGTSVTAGSSSRFTQAIMTQNRNEVKTSTSLGDGYDSSLKNLTS